jgi:hypothetical protein
LIGTIRKLLLLVEQPFELQRDLVSLATPQATLPLPSPTTTKALKLNLFPPFSTLVTLLTVQTFLISFIMIAVPLDYLFIKLYAYFRLIYRVSFKKHKYFNNF